MSTEDFRKIYKEPLYSQKKQLPLGSAEEMSYQAEDGGSSCKVSGRLNDRYPLITRAENGIRFLTRASWSIRLGCQWFLYAWLASMILFLTGCTKVAVPNVEGLTRDAATTSITSAKLKVGSITQQTSNTMVAGNVIGQDPASGSSSAEGSPVNLVISSGPQMVAVPKVEALTQDDATKVITAAKLTMGDVTQQASSTVATGNVIRQDPASGSSSA